MTRWYAVHTQAGSELWARSNLWERGIEVYLPRYLKRRRHARRTDWIATPLFPRYLFVRSDLGGGARKSIDTAPGVIRLLCMGKAPSPVADAIIAEIRAREGEGELVQLNEAAGWRTGCSDLPRPDQIRPLRAGMEGPDQRNRHTGQRQHQSTCSSHGNRCLNSTNQAADITAMRDSHPLSGLLASEPPANRPPRRAISLRRSTLIL